MICSGAACGCRQWPASKCITSPVWHTRPGPISRATGANSFMYPHRLGQSSTHQNWGFSCLATLPAPGVDDGMVTGHWLVVTNIKHQHIKLSQPRLLQDYCVLLIPVCSEAPVCLLPARDWAGFRRAGSSFPPAMAGRSLQSRVTPAHVFNEYKRRVRMRKGGRVWAVRVCSESLPPNLHTNYRYLGRGLLRPTGTGKLQL